MGKNASATMLPWISSTGSPEPCTSYSRSTPSRLTRCIGFSSASQASHPHKPLRFSATLNAGGEPRLIAGAMQERRLLGVGSTAGIASMSCLRAARSFGRRCSLSIAVSGGSLTCPMLRSVSGAYAPYRILSGSHPGVYPGPIARPSNLPLPVVAINALYSWSSVMPGSIFACRWRFQMQAVNVNDQFSFCGPSTEVEAQHLIRPLGRCSSDPQADQQARNKGRIHLEAYPVDPLAQQMPAAQHTFDPAEKQLHRPAIAIRHGQQLGVQVQSIRDQDQGVGRAVLPRLARRDLHQAERLRQQAGMVWRTQAAEDRIAHDPHVHGGGRQGALLLHLVGGVVLHPTEKAARQVVQLLKQAIVNIAPIDHIEAARPHQAP